MNFAPSCSRSLRAVAAAALLLHAGLAAAQSVVIVGPEGRSVAVDAAALAREPRETVLLNDHGKPVPHAGVPLTRLLARAGAPTGAALRGAGAAMTVIVTGRDGYRAALSLAETDPSVGDDPIILADRKAGGPLAAQEGPFRLVVGGDRRPMRSVRMVERIEVRAADTAAARR